MSGLLAAVDTGDLVRALAAADHVDAVRALAEGIEARSVHDRIAIVTAFSPPASVPPGSPEPRAKSNPEIDAAVERLLADRLADPEHAKGPWMGSGEIGQEPVVGEMAAWTLAERDPAHWKFDPKASADERQAARLALASAWRVKQGKSAVEPPKGPTVAPLSPERAQPLVSAWLDAADDRARAAAEDALVGAGLGALPPLRAARDRLAKDDTRREALDRFVRRLAWLVREVKWAEKGPKPNASLSAYVDGTKGRPITGAWITGLWRQVAVDTPEGATGIDLRLVRTADGTGAELDLELTTDLVPWGGGDGGWVLSGDGLELVDDSFVRDATSWWHEARAPQVDAGLHGPDNRDVRIRWTIKRGKG
jgi:hypothetical protein